MIEDLRRRLIQLTSEPGPGVIWPLWGELRALWREADRRFDEGEPGAFLDKWACRALWQRMQDLESAVPDELRPALVRQRLWTVEDAVFSCWADTLGRWEENRDDRYLRGALDKLLIGLPDDQLPALRRAVEPLASPGLGYVVFSLVRRLVKSPLPGATAEALAAFRVPMGASYTALALALLAPLLDAGSLEAEIAACWELVRREMSVSIAQQAYRSNDWSLLIELSAMGQRRARLLELESLVETLPAPLRGVCQDHLDLNGLVGVAWAGLGEIERALAWARKAEPSEQESALAMVIAALPSPRREAEAQALLAAASSEQLGSLLPTLQAISTEVASLCLRASVRLSEEDRRWFEQSIIPYLAPEEAEEILGLPLGEEWSLRCITQRLCERAELHPAAPIGPQARSWLTRATEALVSPEADDRPALGALLGALPPAERRAVFGRVLCWLAAPAGPEDADDREALRGSLRESAALLRPEEQSAHQTAVDTLCPPERSEDLLAALLEARRQPRRDDLIAQAIFETVHSPGTFPAPESALRLLVGEVRSPLILALFRAGRWARLAAACRDDVWWPMWLQRVASSPAPTAAEEAEMTAISAIRTPAALVEWLDAHPAAKLPGLFRSLSIPDTADLATALTAADPAVTPPGPPPPWRQAFWQRATARASLPPPDTAESLESLEKELLGGSAGSWKELAWRWLVLDTERAAAAARRIPSASGRSEVLLQISLIRGRSDLACEALADMVGSYDPQFTLFPATRQAVNAGFGPDVLALARVQADSSIRIAMLSECVRGATLLCPLPRRDPGTSPDAGELERELDAEILALLASGEPKEHEVLGHAAPFVSEEVRRRIWSHCFAEAQDRFALPFSWQSSGFLELSASLEPAQALDLLRVLVDTAGP